MQQGMEAHETSKTSSNKKLNPTRIREIALTYSYNASPRGPKMFAIKPSKLFLSDSVGFEFIPGKPPFQEKLLGQISTNSGEILSLKDSTPYISVFFLSYPHSHLLYHLSLINVVGERDNGSSHIHLQGSLKQVSAFLLCRTIPLHSE